MNFRTVRFGILAALTAGALLFSACEQTPAGADEPVKDFASVDMTTAEISTSGLAEHLLTEITFDDTSLIRMEPAIAESLYNIAGLADSVVSYGSTGATAEAVLVLHCTSEENAAAAEAKIDQYRAEMAAVYADYNEPESGKLTNALLSCDGVYVVFCVSPDTKAAKTAYHGYVTDTVYGPSAASEG